MKRIAIALLFAVACSKEKLPDVETYDTRTPIAVEYVGAPKLEVRQEPNDTAPVIATYQSGESLSVLAKQGEWTEVRVGDRSGWARGADLVTGDVAKAQAENPVPRFRRPPMPVSAPSARGEIFLEASVNTDGDVTAVRAIVNTTGSEDLLQRNIAALRAAQFHPIVVKGERKTFKYDHRVTY